jgi:hypothetical protein
MVTTKQRKEGDVERAPGLDRFPGWIPLYVQVYQRADEFLLLLNGEPALPDLLVEVLLHLLHACK